MSGHAAGARRVDLADFQAPGRRVFVGAGDGARIRAAARLDMAEAAGIVITVHVPEDTLALTSSFARALWGPAIARLGPAAFRDRYRFTGAPIDRVLRDVVRELQRAAPPLQAGPGGALHFAGARRSP